MKQFFSYCALFIFGLTGNLIAQDYASNWTNAFSIASVGDHINVYPNSSDHGFWYFDAGLNWTSSWAGHDCCVYNPMVADHEDQDGYVVFWPTWGNATIEIITPTYANNGGIEELGLAASYNGFSDKWNPIKGESHWTNGFPVMNDNATLIAYDDIILDLEVDYTNNDYSIARIDTIPVFAEYYETGDFGSRYVQGVAAGKFESGRKYISRDGTRHIAIVKDNGNVNGEQVQVNNIAFSIKTDSGWKSSFEKVYLPQYDALFNWEFQDDYNSIKWIDEDGASVFPLNWYWNALAAQEEFFISDSTFIGHFTRLGLPLVDATWNNNNDPDLWEISQQTDLVQQLSMHTQTAERNDIIAETYSGDGNYLFIAFADMSIHAFELLENGDYGFVKQFWSHQDAQYWNDNDKKRWSVISLTANYDGTKVWAKNRDIGDWQGNDNWGISGPMYEITLDFSKPYLTHLSQNEENPLEFTVSFNETVLSKYYDSNGNYSTFYPKPTDFDVLLDGEAVNESIASIRNVRSTNQDPSCPDCYNDSESFILSLRTPNGAISGDLSFAISESADMIDRYDNSIDKDSTTNSVSITDFDGLGYILNAENTEELIANLNYAGSSDTLLLQKGVYELENGIRLGGKAITLTSTYDPSVDNQDAIVETIIVYTGTDDCYTFLSAYPREGELTIINGLTFQGRKTTCESRNAIGGDGSVMFMNNIVKGFNYGLNVWGNSNDKKEGVDFQQLIENNLFTDNYQGIMMESAEALVTDNLLWRNGADETTSNNQCRQGGISIDNDDSYVLYNIILENTRYQGCTNYSPGVAFGWQNYTIFMNNVVYGNSGSKANNISQSQFGFPLVDHNVIGDFGIGRNKVVNPGPNNFDENPQITISEEPLAEEEGYMVMQHMGLYVKVNENSIIFGNGFEVEATEGMIGHRLPQPFGSAPDILAFEHSNGMMVNPMVSVDLNYPVDGASNIGVNPAFGWEPIKYATQYEVEISSSSEFTNSLKVVVQGLEMANLENNLEVIDGAYYWRVRGINPTKVGEWSEVREFMTGTSSVSNETLTDMPMKYELFQNYPNPFNPSTQIKFALPEASVVRVEVYNGLGQQVAVLTNGFMNAGYHQLSFKASDLSSGIYLYKITTPSFTETKKMLLMK